MIGAFESERPKPNGTIGLWKTDGTLLVRARQVEALVGKKMAENWLELERISSQPTGCFLSKAGPIDGEARLVGYARLKDSPLARRRPLTLRPVIREACQNLAAQRLACRDQVSLCELW